LNSELTEDWEIPESEYNEYEIAAARMMANRDTRSGPRSHQRRSLGLQFFELASLYAAIACEEVSSKHVNIVQLS